MSNVTLTIGTHDGHHHTDDVVAVAVLMTIFKEATIVRSRDPKILDRCDFLVDVGEIYDHQRRRYDHHMRNSPTDEYGHVYSSAGLIWKHYAEGYLAAIGIPKVADVNGIRVELRTEVKNSILNKWIRPIDLVDNGNLTGPTVVSELVNSMRPTVYEKTNLACDRYFLKAVEMIQTVLERTCFHTVDFVLKKTRFTLCKKTYLNDDRIVLCDDEVPSVNQYCGTEVDFVVYPVKDFVDQDKIKYVINPIPIAPRRNLKIDIPVKLLGASREAINKITGIEGVLFIHHSGFVIHAKMSTVPCSSVSI